jgi:signal transduction histidine kinase
VVVAAAEIVGPGTQKPLLEALRTVSVFADLPEDQLAWFAGAVTEEVAEAGTLLFKAGDPAEYMSVILEGELRYQPTRSDAPVMIGRAGLVTGLLPHSRLTHFKGDVHAITRVRAAMMYKDRFPEMLERIPAIGPRLISVMADRIRTNERETQEREKLLALSKFSAGLAHELNNPVSAVRHAATNLRGALRSLEEANYRLARMSLTPDKSRCIGEFERIAREQLAVAPQPDSLERSDREDAVSSWLQKRDIAGAWRLAPSLVDAGFDTARLADIGDRFSREMLEPVLERVTSTLLIERLLQTIDYSTAQITNLVTSIKDYTYMDQAPEQEIDLHRGIENTLVMLAHCLTLGIQVVKQFDLDLPKICAWGRELNLVWTNLIENALDAMEGNGTLTLRTSREIDMVLVEIGDTGCGIPKAIQDRIFEPFFTTKEVGAGMGIGLDTVYRIVQKHYGNVRFTSEPGSTVFEVRLPLQRNV